MKVFQQLRRMLSCKSVPLDTNIEPTTQELKSIEISSIKKKPKQKIILRNKNKKNHY